MLSINKIIKRFLWQFRTLKSSWSRVPKKPHYMISNLCLLQRLLSQLTKHQFILQNRWANSSQQDILQKDVYWCQSAEKEPDHNLLHFNWVVVSFWMPACCCKFFPITRWLTAGIILQCFNDAFIAFESFVEEIKMHLSYWYILNSQCYEHVCFTVSRSAKWLTWSRAIVLTFSRMVLL